MVQTGHIPANPNGSAESIFRSEDPEGDASQSKLDRRCPARVPQKEFDASVGPPVKLFKVEMRCPLSNGQDEGAAGPTAITAQISRVSARSIYRYTRGPRIGDQGRSDRDLQLGTAHDCGRQCLSVP